MNKLTTLDLGHEATWQERFEAALGRPGETFLLMKIAAEMEAEGEPLFADVMGVTEPECRDEAIGYVRQGFAEWDREDAQEGLFGGYGETDRYWRDSFAAERMGMGERHV